MLKAFKQEGRLLCWSRQLSFLLLLTYIILLEPEEEGAAGGGGDPAAQGMHGCYQTSEDCGCALE